MKIVVGTIFIISIISIPCIKSRNSPICFITIVYYCAFYELFDSHITLLEFSSNFGLIELADMQRSHNYNKRNNHFLLVSIRFYSFRIRKNIGRSLSTSSLLSYDYILGRLFLIVKLLLYLQISLFYFCIDKFQSPTTLFRAP